MISRKQLMSATAAGATLAVTAAAVALGAAPLPRAGKYYDNSKQTGSKVSVFLLIGANPDQIVKGADFFHGTPGSSVAVNCPHGQAQTGFGGATLKLSGRHYVFSDAYTSHAQIIEAKPGGGEKLVTDTIKITVTGTVTNQNKITGTVAATGGGCIRAATRYTAGYDPTFSQ